MAKHEAETKKDSEEKSGPLRWLASRFGLGPFLRHVVYREVPNTPWYYGAGSALLFLFIVLIVTGAALALTYSPSPSTAYESLVQITYKDTLGGFLRALHYWSAGMMVILLFYHMFRQILMGGYLPPREGIWIIGVGLFILVLTNSFTGYTLRWDERAIYALRIPLHMMSQVPFIGDELVRLVQGGWELGANTLSRMYAVHVIVVPLTLAALIGFHLYLVILHGVTPPAKGPPGHRRPEKVCFYPYTVAESGSFSLGVFVIVVLLALIAGPSELYPPANLTERTIPKEEWWLAWYSSLAALLPPWLAARFHFAFPLLVIALLLALPFLDRKRKRGVRERPLAVITITFLVIAFGVLSSLRVQSPWTAWPRTEPPPLPKDVKLSGSAAEGRVLFTRYGCFNCHAIGGHGSGFAPNLTGIDSRISHEALKRYILSPPDGVAMPAYRGRISDEDLQRIVDFVLVAQTFPNEYSPDYQDKMAGEDR